MSGAGAALVHETLDRDGLSLVLSNDTKAIGPGQSVVRTFLEAHGTAERRIFQAELVFEELVTNTVKYGFSTPGPHQLKVRVELQPATIALTFEDDGHPFDPTACISPDRPDSIENARIGGLGIMLIRKVASRLHYERVGSRNVVQVDLPRV